MAYGQGQGQQNRPAANGGFKKPVVTSQAPATGTATASAAGGTKGPSNGLFKVFKNKNGNGYSVQLKEEITIPAGTRVAIFEDTLKGKDGTTYEVLSVTKLKEREQA